MKFVMILGCCAAETAALRQLFDAIYLASQNSPQFRSRGQCLNILNPDQLQIGPRILK